MSAKFEKFGLNRFGIVNSDGEVVSEDYLRRYIHCWCRVSDGFTHNRKANIEYFMSDEFLAAHPGATASQIGKFASLSDRWNAIPAKPARDAHAEFVAASLADAH
jgi:hypothetical protein